MFCLVCLVGSLRCTVVRTVSGPPVHSFSLKTVTPCLSPLTSLLVRQICLHYIDGLPGGSTVFTPLGRFSSATSTLPLLQVCLLSVRQGTFDPIHPPIHQHTGLGLVDLVKPPTFSHEHSPRHPVRYYSLITPSLISYVLRSHTSISPSSYILYHRLLQLHLNLYLHPSHAHLSTE